VTVKSELYEKAIEFFERASEIQPQEVKWKLMVASCHRRMANYAKALECYEAIHAQHPDDVECECPSRQPRGEIAVTECTSIVLMGGCVSVERL